MGREQKQLVRGAGHLCKKQLSQKLGPGKPTKFQMGNMGSEEINPNSPGNQPELHLLLARGAFEEPLYKSLFRELDEFFFPKKLPPLKLESKPEPVKDIWGFYNYKKNGALGSTGVHVLIIGLIALSYVVFRHASAPVVAAKPTVTLVDPADIPPLKPSKTQVGGGGG